MTWASGAFADFCVLQKLLPYRASSALTAVCILKSRFDGSYFSDPRLNSRLLYCVIAICESVLKAVELVVKARALFPASVAHINILYINIYGFDMYIGYYSGKALNSTKPKAAYNRSSKREYYMRVI
jgi:hypothetical protein